MRFWTCQSEEDCNCWEIRILCETERYKKKAMIVKRVKKDRLFDSSDSSHMCYDDYMFKDLRECEHFEILEANNIPMTGNIYVSIKDEGGNDSDELQDVLFAPDVNINLF